MQTENPFRVCFVTALKMRYVAAALLVSRGGNDLTRANIHKILESVGVDCDNDKLQLVLDQLKGKVRQHSRKSSVYNLLENPG